MKDKTVTVIVEYTQPSFLSLEEFCAACHISDDVLRDFVAYDIIHPREKDGEWLFDLNALGQIKTALRLHRDLEINLSGVAVVLDLLQELEQLRADKLLLEKHYYPPCVKNK